MSYPTSLRNAGTEMQTNWLVIQPATFTFDSSMGAASSTFPSLAAILDISYIHDLSLMVFLWLLGFYSNDLNFLMASGKQVVV